MPAKKLAHVAQRRHRQRSRHAASRKLSASSRLTLETLERRNLMATLAVDWVSGIDHDSFQQIEALAYGAGNQVFYLNFDGREGVDYDGPIIVHDLQVPAFRLWGDDLIGREDEVRREVLGDLNERFEGTSVRFTDRAPETGEPFSTIYVGGSNRAFLDHGYYLGLAETVDEGNLVRDDEALVFSDNIAWAGGTLSAYSRRLSDIVAHEALHLLGAGHDHEDVDAAPLISVAYAQNVHEWIAEQGLSLFAAQFGPNTSLGGVADQFLHGAYEEDTQSPASNPFGESEPSLRHFWGHDDDYARELHDNAGLFGTFDAAPNRVLKYLTGGCGYAETILGVQIGFDPYWRAGIGRGAIGEFGDGNLATSFEYLGHVAHLLADMTVPAHVHGEQHLEGVSTFYDPFHDYVDGKSFSRTGSPAAAFDSPASARWLDWALTNDDLRRPLSAPITSSPFGACGPSADVANLDGVYQLFLSAATRADDFDSRLALGQRDRGSRNDIALEPLFGNEYDNWTEQELREEANVLVPLATRSTASLIRQFFAIVDGAPGDGPDVRLTNISSNPAAPTTITNSRFNLAITASDPESGVGKQLYVIESRLVGSNDPWTRHEYSHSGAANANDAWSVELGLPTTGTYEIRVTAENGGGARTTVTGYVSSVPIGPLPGGPDLALQTLSVPEFVNAGATVNVTGAVLNVGTANSQGHSIEFWLSRDNTLDGSDTRLANFVRPSLTAGSADPTFVFSVNIPGTLVPDDYYLIGHINPTDAADAVTTNHTLFDSFTIEQSEPDANRFQFPNGANARAGAYVTQQFGEGLGHLGTDFRGAQGSPVVTVADGVVVKVLTAAQAGPAWGEVVIVRHAGAAWGLGEDYYSMYAHVTSSVRSGDRLFRGQSIGVVGPKASTSDAPHLHFEIRTGADAGHLPGPGYLGTGFDRADHSSITRSGFRITWHDPVKFLTEHLYASPPPSRQIDLDPRYVNAPPRAVLGDSTIIYSEVENLWPTSSGDYEVQYVLSADRQIDSDDRVLATVTRPSLAGNGVDRWSQRVLLPSDITAGSWYVGIFADPRDLIPEINERNNVEGDSTRLLIEAGSTNRPDLTAGRLELAPSQNSYEWGDLVRLQYEVRNIGDAAASATTVRFVLTDDLDSPSVITILATRPLAAIASGQSSTSSLSAQLPTSPPSGYRRGPLYVRMEIDPDNREPNESNEGNNSGQGNHLDWVRLPLGGSESLPDLLGVDVRFTSGGTVRYWGERVDLEYRFANDGNSAARDYRVQVVLSSDSTLQTNRQVLRTMAPGTLLPGEEMTLSIPVVLPGTAPANLRSGPLYLGLVLDSERQVAESNETNNQGRGIGKDYLAVTVVPPPPPNRNAPPTIGTLDVFPPTVERGQQIWITTRDVTDDNDAVYDLELRLDTNDNGQWDASDAYLGHGAKSGTTFSANVTTAGWTPGDRRILARATDNHGLVSTIVTTMVKVRGNFPGDFPDDAYENNDTPATATLLGGGGSHTLTGLALAAGDADYYAVDLLGSADKLDAKIEFHQEAWQGVGQPVGDLTLEIRRFGSASSSGFSDASTTGDTFERVEITSPSTGASLADGRYLVIVRGQGDFERNSTYTLRIDVTPENGAPNAGPLTASQTRLVQGEPVTLTIDRITNVAPGDVDGVHFYDDRNHDGQIQFDAEYLGSDFSPGGYSSGGTHSFTTTTSDWPLGRNRLLALVSRRNGATSPATMIDVDVVPNQAPRVVTFSPPTTVVQGESLDLTVRATDGDGSVSDVVFILETDGNGTLSPGDFELGHATSVGDEWRLAVPTADWTIGANRVYAQPQDNLGMKGNFAESSLAVVASTNFSPTIGGVVAPEVVVRGTTLAVTAADVTDPNHDSVTATLWEDTNRNGALDSGDTRLGQGRNVGADWNWSVATGDCPAGLQKFFVSVNDGGSPQLNTSSPVSILVLDLDGPRVVSQVPAASTEGSVSRVQVRFSEAIDPASFTVDDIESFTGPSGPISVTRVAPAVGGDGTQFDIEFSRQITLGTYRLVLGPRVYDLAANPMDQDADGNLGESVDDRYTLEFDLRSPAADFAWAKDVGGTGGEQAFDVAVDANGYIFVTGTYRLSADMDPGPGVATLNSVDGSNDIFVAKYAPDGSFVWAKSIGALGSDFGQSIAVDLLGNAYVTGTFANTVDFDPGPGVANLSMQGVSDAFLLKLNASGDYVWARRMGGAEQDVGHGVAVDASGNVFVGGHFRATADFSGTMRAAAGDYDAFVASYGSNGTLQWVNTYGGSGRDFAYGLDVGADGAVYATGQFSGAVTFGSTTLATGYGYALKLTNGGGVTWAKATGVLPNEIAVAVDGSVILTGSIDTTVDVDPGPNVVNVSPIGSSDVFVHKLDSAGNLLWFRLLGGTGHDAAYGLDADTDGNIVVTGHFEGNADFDPAAASHVLGSHGGFDAFVAALSSDGNLKWARQLGGDSTDRGYGAVFAPVGHVIATGVFGGTITTDPNGQFNLNLTSRGDEDFYLVSLVTPTPNTPPELLPILDQQVDEGDTVQVIISADDSDAGQSLTYSLESGAPAGATIDPVSGRFTWPTAEKHGPGAYDVTVRVTDNGQPALSDTATFRIDVHEVNRAPRFATLPPKTVFESIELSFQAVATDDDLPAQSLEYSLGSDAPTGASIHSQSGIVTWTPSEEQGPGTFTFTLVVRDNGVPVLEDRTSVTITVLEANLPPKFGAPGDQDLDELSTLDLTLVGADPDVADGIRDTVSFYIVAGEQPGMSLDRDTGRFLWTPGESQDGEFSLTFRAMDNHGAWYDQTMRVLVREVNAAPQLADPGSHQFIVGERSQIDLDASDPDTINGRPDDLNFSVVAGARAGMFVDADTGVFTWTPMADDFGRHVITIRVADTQGAFDDQTVTIDVLRQRPGAVIARTGELFGTIQAAINAASDGDHILVRDGFYDESLIVNKSLTIESENVGGAIIDGPGLDVDDSKVIRVERSSTFIGLVLQNAQNGIYQRDVDAHVRVQRVVARNLGAAFTINNSGGREGLMEIANSLILDSIHGVNINDGGTITIRNSILDNVVDAYVIQNGQNIVPSHNLLHHVGHLTSGAPVATDPNPLTGDPMFADRAAGDYRLLSGSPAINSGLDLGLPFLGSGPDRGPFEFDPGQANRPPVATDDTYSAQNDGNTRIFTVLDNDVDPDAGDVPFVASVSAGSAGGQLQVGAGGKWIRYLPAPGFTGDESFRYVVSDGRGGTDEGSVVVTVRSPESKLAAIYYVFVDDNGKPVSVVAQGETFNVQIWVRDLRSIEQGVFSFKADTFFDRGRVEPISEIVMGARYPYWHEGDLATPGLFDELGGQSNAIPHGPGAQLLATVKMRALLSGAVEFQSDPAETTVFNQVVLYDTLFAISPEQVDYRGESLMVVPLRPTAIDDTFDAVEDLPLSIMAGNGVLVNDLPGTGATLTAVLVTEPRHGTLSLQADGSLTYVAATDFSGTDTFTYQVSDGLLTSNVATVTMEVAAVNDAPRAVADTYITWEDHSLDVTADAGMLANDFDVDGDSMSIDIVTPPSFGSLTWQPNGTFRYVPNANFNGVDRFEYRVWDGTVWSNFAEVVVTVEAVNDQPTAATIHVTTDEDVAATVQLNGDDSDPELVQHLTYTLTRLPLVGVVALSADGPAIEPYQLPLVLPADHLVYRPAPNYSGDDVFEYLVRDDGGVERNGNDTSRTAQVLVNVRPVNDAPFGQDDAYRATQGVILKVDATRGVLANDGDVENHSLAARLITSPTAGELKSFNSDGSFEYLPPSDYRGPVTFTYRTTDGEFESDDIQVTIEVFSYRLRITPQIVNATGDVIAQVVEGDAIQLVLMVADVSDDPIGVYAAYHDVVFDPTRTSVDGLIEYGATFLNAHSGDSSALGLIDELGAADDFPQRGGTPVELARIRMRATAPGTLAFTTDSADQRPIHDSLLAGLGRPLWDEEIYYGDVSVVVLPDVDAVDDTFELDEDAHNDALPVLANDRFAVAGAIVLAVVTPPAHGNVELASDGRSLLYTPHPDYFGDDRLEYSLTDQNGTTDRASVTLTIRPVNDSPAANGDRFTVIEDSADNSFDVLVNDDYRPDAFERLTVVAVAQPSAGGTVSIDANNARLLYTPAANYFGNETFTYTIRDEGRAEATATVTVTVENRNDPPDARDDLFTRFDRGVKQALDVLANDTDSPDAGETLLVTTVGQAARGIVSIDASGRFLWYVPELGYQGRVSFTYTIGDGHGGGDSATVTLTIGQFWRNPRNSLDVNGDSFVAPIDALIVINYLNTNGANAVPDPDTAAPPPPYNDVNGDNFISPIDALLVVNHLNGITPALGGEGESVDAGVLSPWIVASDALPSLSWRATSRDSHMPAGDEREPRRQSVSNGTAACSRDTTASLLTLTPGNDDLLDILAIDRLGDVRSAITDFWEKWDSVDSISERCE